MARIRLIDGVNGDKQVKQLLHDELVPCEGVRSTDGSGYSRLSQTDGCYGRVMLRNHYLIIRDEGGGQRTWCSACALENCPEIVEKAKTAADGQAVRLPFMA